LNFEYLIDCKRSAKIVNLEKRKALQNLNRCRAENHLIPAINLRIVF